MAQYEVQYVHIPISSPDRRCNAPPKCCALYIGVCHDAFGRNARDRSGVTATSFLFPCSQGAFLSLSLSLCPLPSLAFPRGRTSESWCESPLAGASGMEISGVSNQLAAEPLVKKPDPLWLFFLAPSVGHTGMKCIHIVLCMARSRPKILVDVPFHSPRAWTCVTVP